MKPRSLHDVLGAASLPQLESAFEWLARPGEPRRNDALRARWHDARRDPGTRRALAAAIEGEILAMPARDLDHVARRMGVSGLAPTALDVVRLVAGRLAPHSTDRLAPDPMGNPLAPDPMGNPLAPDPMGSAAAALLAPLVAASGLLTSLLVEAGAVRHAHRPSRRHRHGRR